MKQINIDTKVEANEGNAPQKGKVTISSRLVRTSVMLDQYGNEIDKRTRRIIKANEEKS